MCACRTVTVTSRINLSLSLCMCVCVAYCHLPDFYAVFHCTSVRQIKLSINYVVCAPFIGFKRVCDAWQLDYSFRFLFFFFFRLNLLRRWIYTIPLQPHCNTNHKNTFEYRNMQATDRQYDIHMNSSFWKFILICFKAYRHIRIVSYFMYVY